VLKDEDFVHARLALGTPSQQHVISDVAHDTVLAKRSFHEVRQDALTEVQNIRATDQSKKPTKKETPKEPLIRKEPKSSKSKANQNARSKESEPQLAPQEAKRKSSMITIESQPDKDLVKQPNNQSEVKQVNGSSKKIKQNTSKSLKNSAKEESTLKAANEPVVTANDNNNLEAKNEPVVVANYNKAVDAQPCVEVAHENEEQKPKPPSVKKQKKQPNQAPVEPKITEQQETKVAKVSKPKKANTEAPAQQQNNQQPEQTMQTPLNDPVKPNSQPKKAEPKKAKQPNNNQANQAPQPQTQAAEKNESQKVQKEIKKPAPKQDSIPKLVKETSKSVQQNQPNQVAEAPKIKHNQSVLQKSKTQPIKRDDSSDEEIFDGMMKQPKINPALSVAAKPPVEPVEIQNVDPSEDEEEVMNSFNVELSSDDQNDGQDLEEANFLDSSDEMELEDSDLDVKKKPVKKPSFGKQKAK